MQQATVNLFADMGVQPYALHRRPERPRRVDRHHRADLDDHRARPTGRRSPTARTVTVAGTAADTGGGVVAGVEVSVDGGTTWHPATGTTTWTYSWIAHGSPTTTILSRAVDDSGNLEAPGTGVAVAVSCPCSVWGPQRDARGRRLRDGGAIEVGHASSAPTPPAPSPASASTSRAATPARHVGSLWTASGSCSAG